VRLEVELGGQALDGEAGAGAEVLALEPGGVGPGIAGIDEVVGAAFGHGHPTPLVLVGGGVAYAQFEGAPRTRELELGDDSNGHEEGRGDPIVAREPEL